MASPQNFLVQEIPKLLQPVDYIFIIFVIIIFIIFITITITITITIIIIIIIIINSIVCLLSLLLRLLNNCHAAFYSQLFQSDEPRSTSRSRLKPVGRSPWQLRDRPQP